jgi:hypothetical protein
MGRALAEFLDITGTGDISQRQLLVGRDVQPYLGQLVQLSSAVLRSRPYMQVPVCNDSDFLLCLYSFLKGTFEQDRGTGTVTAIRNSGESCMVKFNSSAEFFYNTGHSLNTICCFSVCRLLRASAAFEDNDEDTMPAHAQYAGLPVRPAAPAPPLPGRVPSAPIPRANPKRWACGLGEAVMPISDMRSPTTGWVGAQGCGWQGHIPARKGRTKWPSSAQRAARRTTATGGVVSSRRPALAAQPSQSVTLPDTFTARIL